MSFSIPTGRSFHVAQGQLASTHHLSPGPPPHFLPSYEDGGDLVMVGEGEDPGDQALCDALVLMVVEEMLQSL